MGESQQTGRQGSGRKLWCWHESISYWLMSVLDLCALMECV